MILSLGDVVQCFPFCQAFALFDDHAANSGLGSSSIYKPIPEDIAGILVCLDVSSSEFRPVISHFSAVYCLDITPQALIILSV